MALADRRDWLAELRNRMDTQAWRKDDPFYAAVSGAWDAMHAALRALHESGKGEPAAAPEPPQWVQAMPGAASARPGRE